MNDKPKRRWYQFSLKMMLVVMTLAGIVLARVAYLRQLAAFHEHEAERYAWKLESDEVGYNQTMAVQDREMLRLHTTLATRFRNAVYRPWTIVDESLPPKDVLQFAEPAQEESRSNSPGDDPADPFGEVKSRPTP